ncbi:hypothetical protein GCM10011318_04840 [Phaeocystidibacter marisrubri]|nr:hypothetical protein GCM10011318_04840 [Phaeocystidibacter marisrubri]
MPVVSTPYFQPVEADTEVITRRSSNSFSAPEEERTSITSTASRNYARALDFEVLDSTVDLRGYVSFDAELSSIPSHINNVTRNAEAYRMDGEYEHAYPVAIGVDASRLKSISDIDHVQVLFFDRVTRSWKAAQTLRTDRDILRIEAMVPGETDYFAGLITSPEMPEANAYVPTSVSDIDPVNPATGMRLMQPPSVNRQGSANINYPLWIPQGRNGMTPPLSVSYNSDGGTGWMGMGWNIGSSSISVDTKWGVPVFDDIQESEGYVLDGEALFQEGGFRPNKAVKDSSGNVIVQLRQPSGSRFFPRVQTSYQKIERLGGDPTKYFWKVTDASNTVRYYGTEDGATLDQNSVLQEGTNGNIAKWYLTKVVDQWGNTIEYDYTSYLNTTTNKMKSGGKGMHLSSITYTGFGSTSGRYHIIFNTAVGRKDGSVMMNYGFKVIDDRKLMSIDVKYDSQLLVKYVFGYNAYDQSTHFKTLLQYIAEERGGVEFYRHTMNYYERGLEYDSDPKILRMNHGTRYLSESPWYIKSVLNPLYTYIEPSPIRTSLTEGYSGSGRVGFGLALNESPFGITLTKENTVGAGISSSSSVSDVITQMRDFNGDGIPDVVIDEGDKVYYRPITRRANGTLQIGSKVRIYIDGISRTRNSSTGYQVEVIGPQAAQLTHMNVSFSDGNSEVLRDVIDYNADGYPDLIYPDGNTAKVLFGEMSDNGEYHFRGSSESTFNPVVKGQNAVAAPQGDNLQPMEIVRVWEAFETGQIRITGLASMYPGATGTAQVAVQHNEAFQNGGFQTITPTSPSSVAHFLYLNVAKGDKIFFRMRAGEDGQSDLVKWNPVIRYTSGNRLDGQNTNWGVSSSQAGFLLSSGEGATFQGDQEFRVQLNYSNNPIYSDEVNVAIDVYVNGVLSNTYYQTVEEGTSSSPTNSIAPFVGLTGSNYYKVAGLTSSDVVSLQFRLTSSSNILWTGLLWTPVVEFKNDCVNPVEELYPTPEYVTYNKLDEHGYQTDLGILSSGVDYQLLPVIDDAGVSSVIDKPDDVSQDVVYMTLKNSGVMAEKIAIVFDGVKGTITYKNVDMTQGVGPYDMAFVGKTTLNSSSFTSASKAYFTKTSIDQKAQIEFFAKGPYAQALLDYIQNNLAKFSLYSPSGLVRSITAYDLGFFHREIELLQMNYKHWGVFGWKPHEDSMNYPIQRAQLHIPLGNDPSAYDTTYIKNHPDEYDASKYKFWPLYAIRGENVGDLWGYQKSLITSDRNRDRYGINGQAIAAFRLAGGFSPILVNEFDQSTNLPSISVGPSDPKFTAQGLLTRSTSRSLGISSGTDPIAFAVSVSQLGLYSKQLSSFTDLNGDGYPDILVDDDVIKGQFTNPQGGLGAQVEVPRISILGQGTSLGGNAAWSGSYTTESRKFTLSGNLGAGYRASKSRTSIIDVNGDGIPDSYEDDLFSEKFRLGYGYGFEANVFDAIGTIRNHAYDISLSGNLAPIAVSYSWWVRSLSGGLNVNRAGNYSERFYFDFNGDGLTDYIDLTAADDLWLNTGSEFEAYDITGYNLTQGTENYNKSGSTGVSAQVTFTLGPILWGLKVPVTAGYSDNFSIDRLKTSFMDMNGDGAPDYVETEDGDLKVYYATFGDANKLKSVTNPLKGKFTITYEVVGNKQGYHEPVVRTHLSELENEKIYWDMPSAKWVMSSVVVSDGHLITDGTNDLDGVDEYETKFAYDGGIRIRREREFAGFTRVATIQPNQLGEREDFCAESNDFEIEKKRYIKDEYDCPFKLNYDTTSVRRTGQYNMNVLEYRAPKGTSPRDMGRYLYEQGILENTYLLHVHEWRDSVRVDTLNLGYDCSDPSVEYGAHHYDSWTHQHIELISDEGVDFELRLVESGVSKMSTYGGTLGEVIEQGAKDWLLVDEVYTSDNLPDYITVFPAVTDKRNINFPVVEDRSGINLQKYHLEFDKYFNVVWFEDFGTLNTAQVDTIPVDTIYTGHYEYLTQQNSCADLDMVPGLDVVPIDDYHYYVYVECDSPSYEPDTIYGLYENTSGCGNQEGIGPRAVCDGNELAEFTSTHRKWVIEETIIYKLVDKSTYDFRIIAVMDYFSPTSANNRTNVLQEHWVYTQSVSPSNIRRHSKVESLTTNKKAVQQMGQYLSPSDVMLTDFTYDAMGNLTQVEAPQVPGQGRPTTTFVYDSDVSQFVERVNNPYGDFACTIYDIGYQQVLQTTDINGQVMRFAFDQYRRPSRVWAPRELSSSSKEPTISFEYHPFDTHPYASTYHNTGNASTVVSYGSASTSCDALVPENTLDTVISTAAQTITFTDGLSRAIQVQTLTDWDDPSSGTDHSMGVARRVSGFSVYDKFGQVYVQHNDTLITGTSASTIAFETLLTDTMGKVKFDYLNRPTESMSLYPTGGASSNVDWSTTTVNRSWSVFNGESRYTEITNLDGKSRAYTYQDHKGRQVGSAQEGVSWAANMEITRFVYDELGQLDTVIDPANQKTTYQYDWVGRMIEEVHPDRGRTTNTYDLGGNLVSVSTEGTRESITNGQITFDYDLNRLVGKKMPAGSSNEDLYNVAFTYGQRGDGKNGAGRIVTVEQGDSSAPFLVETLKYDELGQTSFQSRVIKVPQKGFKTYTTNFRYDSFGRMLQMTYPDNEQLDYHYTDLGNLLWVDVSNGSCITVPNLIDTISYDGYDNIVYMKYGNGTKMNYGYHPVTRTLLSSDVLALPKGYPHQQQVMDRSYSYNSLGMISASEITPHRLFMATSSKLTTTYTYDGLMRLKEASTSMSSVSFDAADDPGTPPVTYSAYSGTVHEVSMDYDLSGRITNKVSDPQGSYPMTNLSSLDYSLSMVYDGSKKHKLTSSSEITPSDTANTTYDYNNSGSIKEINRNLSGSTLGSIRILWNEEQQMIADSNDRGIHHYVYDYNGERIMKASFTTSTVNINGDVYTQTGTLDAYKVYVNPYVVAEHFDTEDRLTFHYYMGMQRVASGRFTEQTYQSQQKAASESQDSSEDLVLNQLEEILSEFKLNKGEDYTREELESPASVIQSYPDLSSGKAEGMSTDLSPTTNDGVNEVNCGDRTTEVYWYHPNYLGSVDLITDLDGQVHQFFLYNAWGENMSEYNAQPQGFDSPYRFNGKEVDEETGLAYYGARYYDNQLSIWLSVDPMAMEGINLTMTSYQFTNNNPINLVDPNGTNANPVFDSDGNYIGNTSEGFVGDALIYSGTSQIDFSTMSADQALQDNNTSTMTSVIRNNQMRGEVFQKIMSSIVSNFDGQEIMNGIVFDYESIGSQIYWDASGDPTSNEFSYDPEKDRIYATMNTSISEYTVENIKNAVLSHEYLSHKILDYNSSDRDEYRAYMREMEYMLQTGNNVTPTYRLETMKRMMQYFQDAYPNADMSQAVQQWLYHFNRYTQP